MSRIKQNIILIILAALLLSSACILPRKVAVPEVLPLNAPLTSTELIQRINDYARVKSFSAQTTVYVRDYLTGERAKAKDFPGATGLIRLQRPENVRMLVSFLGMNIADMTSDGQKFRLAIFQPDHARAFVRGSNLKEYHRMEAAELKETDNPSLKEAGALANIRPQHVTSAFLIRPIDLQHDEFLREESRLIEPDTESGKKGRMVERSYYILYILEHGTGGQVFLRHKYWFDRTREGTPLVRQQIFENGDGKLGTDIFYNGLYQMKDQGLVWPEKVRIERRNDGYSIEMELDKETVEINAELPATTFVLENTERLKEIDLDIPRQPRNDTASK